MVHGNKIMKIQKEIHRKEEEVEIVEVLTNLFTSSCPIYKEVVGLVGGCINSDMEKVLNR